MRNDWFYIVNFSLPLLCLLTNWICYRLALHVFPALNRRLFRLLFVSGSLLSLTAVLYARFSFRWHSFPDFSGFIFGVYAAIGWNLSQMIAVVLLPPFLLLFWFFRQRPAITRSIAGRIESLSRRRFLSGLLALPPCLGTGITVSGLSGAHADPEVNRLRLRIPDLPAELSGLTIVQISDTHLGPFFDLDKLDRLLQRVAAERPDLLLITGDLVDDLALLPAALEKIDRLQPLCRLGMYFCLGNHEYFRDISQVRRLLDGSKLTTLTNRHQLLQAGKRPFYLLGVDYPPTRNPADRRVLCQHYFRQAADGVPANAITLLIAHHPDFIFDAFDAGVHLTLAGHTHGGQLGLLGQPVLPFGFQFQRGLYRQDDALAYVNVGAGHWLPFRLGCPAELAVLTLVPAP